MKKKLLILVSVAGFAHVQGSYQEPSLLTIEIDNSPSYVPFSASPRNSKEALLEKIKNCDFGDDLSSFLDDLVDRNKLTPMVSQEIAESAFASIIQIKNNGIVSPDLNTPGKKIVCYSPFEEDILRDSQCFMQKLHDAIKPSPSPTRLHLQRRIDELQAEIDEIDKDLSDIEIPMSNIQESDISLLMIVKNRIELLEKLYRLQNRLNYLDNK